MDRIFRDGRLDDDFSLYVCNPASNDPTMAPEGHSSLYALALVPNTRASIDWEEEGPRMRTRILRNLERRAGSLVEAHIRAEKSLSPAGWENQYEVSHGAVFGPAHSIDQLLAFLLPNRLPSPDNVYLTGGGTNPGSGLPTILESARIAARLIFEERHIPFPASRPIPEPSMRHPDHAERHPRFLGRDASFTFPERGGISSGECPSGEDPLSACKGGGYLVGRGVHGSRSRSLGPGCSA